MASLSFEGETHDEIVRKVRRWLASLDGDEAAALTPVGAVERAPVLPLSVTDGRQGARW
jgi:hypothetical protein